MVLKPQVLNCPYGRARLFSFCGTIIDSNDYYMCLPIELEKKAIYRSKCPWRSESCCGIITTVTNCCSLFLFWHAQVWQNTDLRQSKELKLLFRWKQKILKEHGEEFLPIVMTCLSFLPLCHGTKLNWWMGTDWQASFKTFANNVQHAEQFLSAVEICLKNLQLIPSSQSLFRRRRTLVSSERSCQHIEWSFDCGIISSSLFKTFCLCVFCYPTFWSCHRWLCTMSLLSSEGSDHDWFRVSMRNHLNLSKRASTSFQVEFQ